MNRYGKFVASFLLLTSSLICLVVVAWRCGSVSSETPMPDASIIHDTAAPADLSSLDVPPSTDILNTALCGNSVIDPGETCDKAIAAGEFGACPTDCNDQVVCTTDKVEGGECTATCSNTEITFCDKTKLDGCCPASCDATTDADCSPACGNGLLDEGETCDKSITAGNEGACPTSCDDSNTCTNDKLIGGDCTKECTHTAITVCSTLKSDGCCPRGCTYNTDIDCKSTCGNGVLDKGELCDTAIKSGTGACPTATTCNDKIPCTNDSVTGSGCQLTCSHTEITTCSAKADGCCPRVTCALGIKDGDCASLLCGNGKVDTGETCDTAIALGTNGACPRVCRDLDSCTADALVGNGCTKSCIHTPIVTCNKSVADGCCPAGCVAFTDIDCK